MANDSQRTRRRLVTVSSTGTPWMSKARCEPRRRPRSPANSSSIETSARVGSDQRRPATIWLSVGRLLEIGQPLLAGERPAPAAPLLAGALGQGRDRDAVDRSETRDHHRDRVEVGGPELAEPLLEGSELVRLDVDEERRRGSGGQFGERAARDSCRSTRCHGQHHHHAEPERDDRAQGPRAGPAQRREPVPPGEAEAAARSSPRPAGDPRETERGEREDSGERRETGGEAEPERERASLGHGGRRRAGGDDERERDGGGPARRRRFGVAAQDAHRGHAQQRATSGGRLNSSGDADAQQQPLGQGARLPERERGDRHDAPGPASAPAPGSPSRAARRARCRRRPRSSVWPR